MTTNTPEQPSWRTTDEVIRRDARPGMHHEVTYPDLHVRVLACDLPSQSLEDGETFTVTLPPYTVG